MRFSTTHETRPTDATDAADKYASKYVTDAADATPKTQE